MGPQRFRLPYLVLLPAIVAAAGILGYYSWRAASQFARLGEETIVESTLLIVGEKVDRIEQQLIDADNAVFDLVDLSQPSSIEARWGAEAADIAPSVRSVLVLDDAGNSLAHASLGSEREQTRFLKVLLERILPDLELERQRLGRLKHLHQSYGGTNYLISYTTRRYHGRRHYIVLHHDTDWVVREMFPSLFATDQGKRLYNVVDENHRRVYGPSLARAGDYLVGRRFPTTLYGWRLQVAPKQAPQLDAQSRSRRIVDVALVATAIAIILLGVAFLLWAADKERRLNSLKAEFVANVSHELKTPLSIVRMFAELLLSKRVQSEAKQEQYLELICRESERLSALVENVLDFAALEQGRRQFELREGSLRDVVGRAVDTFRYRMDHGGNEATVHISDELPAVRIDEQAIVLAIINLLDNAMKYGDGSTVELIVEARDGDAVVKVRDHGPGISRDDLKRVFDRFFRSRRKVGEIRGSGIGLSLVKHIAEAHGGRAWAENATDGGAIVGFSIPVAPSAAAGSGEVLGASRA